MTRPVLRRSSYDLSEEQTAVRDSFASFFEQECPTTRVRDVEGVGFDPALWQALVELGVLTMALSEESGGDGGSLVDVVLVAEAAGRALAPVPLVEAVAVARALSRVSPAGDTSASGSAERATFAPSPKAPGTPQLLSHGAHASSVLALIGDELVLEQLPEERHSPPSLGQGDLAWWDPDAQRSARQVLVRGADSRAAFAAARSDWQVLTAAMLVGMARGALDLSVEYACDREAFGVPIGAFQAISHRLVDVRDGIEGAHRLVLKAAWFIDNEPAALEGRDSMAYLAAAETASLAARTGIHTQGGFGFTLESDLQLFFRRSKAAVLIAGDPSDELLRIADALYGPIGTSTTDGR